MKTEDENYDLARWLSGGMPEDELAAFKKTPSYRTYEKIRDQSKRLRAPDFDADAMYGRITHFRNKKTRVVSLSGHWLRIAAVILVLLGIGAAFKVAMPVSEHAINARQHSFTLPDNSQVTLNSGSKVEYKTWNWDDERKLSLDGEAYFRVAKGGKFEVMTYLGKVTVLGTKFNVKARKGRFDVTCYEGRVKVSVEGSDMIITKGQYLAFSNGERIAVKADPATSPQWLKGELVFSQENLTAIFDELTRQYDVKIEFTAESLPTQLFTGVLPMNDLAGALQILASTYHLKIGRTTDKIIIETLNVQG